MNFKFDNCIFDEIQDLFDTYISKLNSPFDSYLEDHIMKSSFYKISANNEKIGYFAIHKKEMLTQFYIIEEYREYSQIVFNEIKKYEMVNFAYVFTADEFFLSNLIDNHSKIEKQAYFFKDKKPNQKTVINLDYRCAEIDDLELIKEKSGEFFDAPESQVKDNMIYIFSDSDKIIGFGIIEKSLIIKNHASIGMYVVEEYRKNGYGSKILLSLKDILYNRNMIPIAGCWYYNHNSKKTLEKAGFYSDSRMLKVFF